MRAARAPPPLAAAPSTARRPAPPPCRALTPTGAPAGFSAPAAPAFRLAVLGDLHLDERHKDAFDEAKDQLRELLTDGIEEGGGVARLVQLGDLGASNAAPGTPALFAQAREYLRGAAGTEESGESDPSATPATTAPPALVVGNHDLEATSIFDALHPNDDTGADADAANLAAWRDAFSQNHFWTARLGPALLIGVSTTRWRSNADSVHEVCVSQDQVEALELTLAVAHAARVPVIVFSHAPPAGCGLRVVQGVHVRNRCAYLNHSDPKTAARFVDAVERHPAVALWFSGHYHLSHNYATSLSVVGRTTFVQVGVIGPGSSRDGLRQSRFVTGDASGFRLWSVDHGAGGALRLDLERGWWDEGAPAVAPVPARDLLDPGADAAWLASSLDCAVEAPAEYDDDAAWPAAGAAAAPTEWHDAGGGCLLAHAGATVVEYSASLRSPVGFVFDELPPGVALRFVDGDGRAAAADAAAAVEAVAADSTLLCRRERNADGGFSHAYQGNKWRRARRAAREAARAAA